MAGTTPSSSAARPSVHAAPPREERRSDTFRPLAEEAAREEEKRDKKLRTTLQKAFKEMYDAEEKKRQAKAPEKKDETSENINDSDLNDEEKVKVIAEQMKKLVDITLNLLTESTEYVQTTDGIIVTDKNHIAEFYRNSESRITRDIQARAEVMAKEAAIKPVKVKCEKCDNEYDMTINFDYASFFAVGF